MLKMYFFDQAPYARYYGNGDCTYIELPDGKHVLIDVTSKEGGKIIAKKLIDINVRGIDYLVISHLHADHTGGFSELVNLIPVKHVILSGYGFQNVESDVNFLKLLREKNIPMLYVRMGDLLRFGNVQLQFMFPPKDVKEISPEQPYKEQEKNSNIYSLVFKITYGKFSALFVGDIYKEAEEQLIQIYGNELGSTFYKIPHHGNDTSDPRFALDKVKPQVAVTMCRFCEWEVQKNFSNEGIVVYGPFYDGTITMQTDGNMLQVYCEKGYREFLLS